QAPAVHPSTGRSPPRHRAHRPRTAVDTAFRRRAPMAGKVDDREVVAAARLHACPHRFERAKDAAPVASLYNSTWFHIGIEASPRVRNRARQIAGVAVGVPEPQVPLPARGSSPAAHRHLDTRRVQMRSSSRKETMSDNNPERKTTENPLEVNDGVKRRDLLLGST